MENITMKPMPLEMHTKHNIILSLIGSIQPSKKKETDSVDEKSYGSELHGVPSLVNLCKNKVVATGWFGLSWPRTIRFGGQNALWGVSCFFKRSKRYPS